jgi:diguanylate cyclase (GGDEF)-like protein
MTPPIRILCVAPSTPELWGSPFGPFVSESCASLEQLAQMLCAQPCDAVLIHLPDGAALTELVAWPALSHAVLDAAVLVVAPEPDAAASVRLLQLGVQDVLPAGRPAVDMATLGRALRLAVERKRLEQAARRAYATDLSTGLPNHAQLLEHMSHLVALREREPAPMALIVLRIDGLVAVGATLGLEAANVLRRKVAVRLRSGLRASDVVASIGADVFAVLLAWIDSPQDGERVAVKLAASLTRPFVVAGRDLTVAVNAGLASYPEHGKDADSLLRRALGQAASQVTVGHSTVANVFDRGPSAAANDE